MLSRSPSYFYATARHLHLDSLHPFPNHSSSPTTHGVVYGPGSFSEMQSQVPLRPAEPESAFEPIPR